MLSLSKEKKKKEKIHRNKYKIKTQHTPKSFDRYNNKWMFGITPMLKSSKDC